VPQEATRRGENPGMESALIVSSHLDDAAISVGIMAQRLSMTHALTVATVFTEHDEGPLSYSARIFNTSDTGSASQCMIRRRAEDWLALSLLGATPVHLGFVDATFRRDKSGVAICERPEDIVSADPHAEEAFVHTVTSRLAVLIGASHPEILLVPFGLGNHVDHKIVRIAADLAIAMCASSGQLRAVVYYEDLPYAYSHDPTNSNISLSEWESVIVTATDVAWERKLGAIRCYSTQLRFIDVGQTPWHVSLEEYARMVGKGQVAERLWVTGDRSTFGQFQF